MTHLSPQLHNDAGALDMNAVAQHNPSFVPNCRGFRVDFRELDMSVNSERPTLRFHDGGGLHTTGYDYQSWTKDNTAAYAQRSEAGAAAATWIDPGTGLSNLGIIWGYYQGRLMDAANNVWSVYGNFSDDFANDLTKLEIFGFVTLDSPATGLRIQSGNATNWDGGTMYHQSW